MFSMITSSPEQTWRTGRMFGKLLNAGDTDGWLFGHGWSAHDLGGWPDGAMLERVAPGRLVELVDQSRSDTWFADVVRRFRRKDSANECFERAW